MSDIEWEKKWRESEAKRAELVLENHLLHEEVEQLRSRVFHKHQRSGDLTLSPIRGATNDTDRIRDLENELYSAQQTIATLQNARDDVPAQASSIGQAPIGFTTITPVPQASERDFRFEEEDNAKKCAEEIMSRLLRSLHTQREAQERLATVELEVVELRSQLDESRGREVVLSQMVAAYSDAVNSNATRSGAQTAVNGKPRLLPDGPVALSSVETLLQDCMNNLTRLDAVKRRLVDEKLKETLDENEHLKMKLASLSPAPKGGNATSTRNTEVVNGGGVDSTARTGVVSSLIAPPLLSSERDLLVRLMERDNEYQQRMQQLKGLVLEKEKVIRDLKGLLQAHTMMQSKSLAQERR